MTGTPLEDAVRRLERAIVRLEGQRRPDRAPPPPPAGDVELQHLRRRHGQLRTRVEEAVRSLDRLIGDAD